MKTTIFLILLISSLLVTTSCSLNSDKTSLEGVEITNTVSLPWFVANTPKNTNEFVYGVGNGERPELAIAMAKKAIVDYYKSSFEEELKVSSETIEIELKGTFQEYYNQQMQMISDLEIPSINHVQTDKFDKEYYSLVKLDRNSFESSQRDIEKEILVAMKEGDSQANPGLRLQSYYLATSFLSKLIQPLKYKNELVYVYLARQVNSIFSNVKFSYEFSEFSAFTDYQPLIVNVKANNKVLSGIPLLIGGGTYYPDQEGNYYLKIYENKPFDLDIHVDVNRIKMYPGLVKSERNQAIELIRVISPLKETLKIIPKNLVKSYLEMTHFVNKSESVNLPLLKELKETLLNKGISISPKNEAILEIEITTSSQEIEYTEDTGYTYDAWAVIKVSKKGIVDRVIDMKDEDSRKNTRSTSENKTEAEKQATMKINSMIIDKINEIEFVK